MRVEVLESSVTLDRALATLVVSPMVLGLSPLIGPTVLPQLCWVLLALLSNPIPLESLLLLSMLSMFSSLFWSPSHVAHLSSVMVMCQGFQDVASPGNNFFPFQIPGFLNLLAFFNGEVLEPTFKASVPKEV
jgi:hypothetical protein